MFSEREYEIGKLQQAFKEHEFAKDDAFKKVANEVIIYLPIKLYI